MPLFDFQCARCGHAFEELARQGDDVACPVCGGAASPMLAAPSPLTGKARSTMPGPRDHGCCGSRRVEKGCIPGSCCGKA